jgi:D-arabinose 1-dehydrogenase-like Zn-dependent alcohol dehydrogenase
LRNSSGGSKHPCFSVVDGELPDPRVPIIPGHEIVGRIDAIGSGVEGLHRGERVGIPWLGHTCGVCPYCRSQRENLCDRPLFTADIGVVTQTTTYPLKQANQALADPRAGRFEGAAVLVP